MDGRSPSWDSKRSRNRRRFASLTQRLAPVSFFFSLSDIVFLCRHALHGELWFTSVISFSYLELNPFLIEHSVWMLKMSAGTFSTVKASSHCLTRSSTRGAKPQSSSEGPRERSSCTISWTSWELHLLKVVFLSTGVECLFLSSPPQKQGQSSSPPQSLTAWTFLHYEWVRVVTLTLFQEKITSSWPNKERTQAAWGFDFPQAVPHLAASSNHGKWLSQEAWFQCTMGSCSQNLVPTSPVGSLYYAFYSWER